MYYFNSGAVKLLLTTSQKTNILLQRYIFLQFLYISFQL